jgi:preprotein translocase subunit SecA
VYAHKRDKYDAVADRVEELHESGRPVLVGTVSVEVSELISAKLTKRRIKHNVLNAKQHEREAEIVADAGRLGAVTIATNMAGRGTDILLGGNPEFEAKRQMRKQGYTAEQISFATGFGVSDDDEMNAARTAFKEYYTAAKEERDAEQEKVRDLGGLVIIGTERHEARRIDNQLRGRSGRQGDPGETWFMISLEDDIVRLHGGERVERMLEDIDPDYSDPVDAGNLMRTIENAQKAVEDKNFYIRKYVLQYDNVKNKQRETIYEQRRMVLNGDDLSDYIREMTHGIIEDITEAVTDESRYPEEWDLQRLEELLCEISPECKDRLDLSEEKVMSMDAGELRDEVTAVFDDIYSEKEAEIGSSQMRDIERMALLKVVDEHWIEHIDAMEQLEEGIGLRGIGQIDPAMAFSKEGYEMFDELIDSIRRETVKTCYSITVR